METHTTHRARPYSGGGGGGVSTTSGGGREDCWSEAASAVLIQAWGDRYLLLNRGNLRQKDWKDVADAVNSRQDVVKLAKTDVQCKNRIDTIKKKYKLEKSKPPPSTWPFFTRLDQLIGSNTPSVTTKRFQPPTPTPLLHKPPTPTPLPPVTFTVKPYNPNPNPNLYSGGSSSKSRLNNNNSGGSTRNYEDDENGNEDEEEEEEEEEEVVARRKERMVEDSSEGVAFREMARAILKFGEVYERMESSKQEQMMELERQRMEFTKDLEFQRMQMFMEAQLELEKMKRPKYASGNGKKL